MDWKQALMASATVLQPLAAMPAAHAQTGGERPDRKSG